MVFRFLSQIKLYVKWMKLTGLGYRKIKTAYLETTVKSVHDCDASTLSSLWMSILPWPQL